MTLIAKLGFDGTSDEAAWTGHNRYNSPRYAVGGIGDFKVTAGGGGDRAITIAAGNATAKGMSAENTAPIVMNLSAPGSGTRHAMIVLRRNWTTNALSIVEITGSASVALPSRNTWSSISQIDDQPLALVAVTASQTSVGLITDLRTWQPAGGGVIIAQSILARSLFDDLIGAQVRVGDITYTRLLVGSSATWEPDQFEIISTTAFSRSTASFVNHEVQFRRVNDMVSMYALMQRHGAGGIPAGSNGNIGNELMFAITDARFHPRSIEAAFKSAGAGFMLSGTITAGGNVYLCSMPPGVTMPAAYGPFSIEATYIGKPM
jgi:hypothetical protein